MLHLQFQRSEPLDNLVDAHCHAVDRIELIAMIRRQGAWFQKKQFGISENGSEGVVQAVPHIEHIAAKGRVLLSLGERLLGTPGTGCGLDATKNFSSQYDEAINPALVVTQREHAGVGLAQGGGGRRIGYQTNNRPSGGFEGAENRDERVAGSRAGDGDITGGENAVGSGSVADSYKGGHSALALPARNDRRGEFRVSRNQ
jgi:hypothetical protein